MMLVMGWGYCSVEESTVSAEVSSSAINPAAGGAEQRSSGRGGSKRCHQHILVGLALPTTLAN